jgi:hypothetical protein
VTAAELVASSGAAAIAPAIAVAQPGHSAFPALAVLMIAAGCHRAPKSTARTELEVQGREIFRYGTKELLRCTAEVRSRTSGLA